MHRAASKLAQRGRAVRTVAEQIADWRAPERWVRSRGEQRRKETHAWMHGA
jgi:hypothetical protein